MFHKHRKTMSGILSIIEEDNAPRLSRTASLGFRGEALAAEFLVSKGYRIIVSNFKVPVGRNSKGVSVTGEIDVIALDGETLCFVEVKTRRSDDFLPIIAAVNLRKQRQITRTARVYRRIFNVWERSFRFDVVTVLLAQDKDPVIEIAKDFWSEASFRKRIWQQSGWSEFV
jgi:putative endonuclease